MKASLTLLGATVTAVFAWLYFALVLLLGGSTLGIYIGPDVIALSIPLVGVVSYFLFRAMIARGARGTVLRVSVAVFFTVASLLVADVLYSFHLNSEALQRPRLEESRMSDPHLTAGEVLPRLYYPTEANFRLHKPNVSMAAAPYGAFYSPALTKSPTLSSIFTVHWFSTSINGHGFRDTVPLSQADIFALGDSFTFGWAVDAEDSWVGKLQDSLHRAVYNLGIHDSSPKQEVELLKYTLQSFPDSLKIRRLLWMIYEGNDLEDSYAESAPAGPEVRGGWEAIAKGTVLQDVARLPWLVKQQAVITKIRNGDVTFRQPGPTAADDSPYVIDGIESPYPFYESERLGPRLFYPSYVDRAGKPAAYVLNHPNRPRLDAVFEEMARLAEEDSFRVTVIIAPTAARVHGPFFDGFPAVSETPHFIDYVADLSERMGFETLDLLPLLAPYGNEELLYFRADDHWNARGHAVVADIIRREAFAEPSRAAERNR